MLQGVSASAGTAVGRVFVWRDQRSRPAGQRANGIDEELDRLNAALTTARSQLEDLAHQTTASAARDILRAQSALLGDPTIGQEAETAIHESGMNAASAMRTAGDAARERLLRSSAERIRARAADVDDVVGRVLDALDPGGPREHPELPEDAVVVAIDMLPSQTSTIDRSRVRAFLLADGGTTSHTAIIARTYGIPAVVQLGSHVLTLENGVTVGVDGDAATVTVEPPDEQIEDLRRREAERQARLRSAAHGERIGSVRMTDDRTIRLAANVGSAEQVQAAVQWGANEVGLFRTEFMFYEHDTLPSEDEQAEEYLAAVEALAGGRVVFRTFDVGGDKPLPALAMPTEPNPMLGRRGIRLALEHPQLLVTQLRALLRASASGPIGVMFPMVSALEEVRAGLDALKQARAELHAQGVWVGDDVQVGAMVETPAAALMADELATTLDFISIGTNDLLQYVLAAEREGGTVAELLDPYHPALWRAVRLVTQGAAGTSAWVGVCGEIAGDPNLQLALVGAGVHELSMVADRLPDSQQTLSRHAYEDLRDLFKQLLAQTDTGGVRQVLELAGHDQEEASAPSDVEAGRTVEIRHSEGLHARPAHEFIERAGDFDSDITITKGSDEADAKSLLAVLALGADTGDRIHLRAEGPDAQRAVDQLAALLQDE